MFSVFLDGDEIIGVGVSGRGVQKKLLEGGVGESENEELSCE